MSKSEVVTREDLANIFGALGEGSYGTRIDALEEKTSRPILHAAAEITVNSASLFEVGRITVPPNSRYLILASAASAIDQTQQQSCYISIMAGTFVEQYGGRSVRVPGGAGGGCATWLVGVTGDSEVQVAVRVYGYNTTSHKERGEIAGIPF